MSDILPTRQVQVGIIGCGNIFPAYAKGSALFRKLKLKAIADVNREAALARSAEFGVPSHSVEELLADPEIQLVINLTIPKVHAAVSRQILQAGKHAYSEKPLAVDLDEGRDLVALASELGLRLGCAPDTFLGAGLQTARKVIDDGWVGRPIGGTAFMLSRGPESWHPNPAFFYEKGAGPMLDMGPYYLTALVHLLGPVQSVTAITAKTQAERVATCQAQFGRRLPVEVPTHYSGSLLFANGAVINLGISFDVIGHRHSPIEIYGTEGSLEVPDPNQFCGPVSLRRLDEGEWQSLPLAFGYKENSRGIGAADMAHALDARRSHRCSGDLALHVLEVMTAFETASNTRSWVDIQSPCLRPPAFPLGMIAGILDDE